jgi:hypothetical protein
MALDSSGRELPGRFAFPAVASAGLVAAPAALMALVLLTRVPLRTRYLLNWDATQFALGMSQFDIAHHQPHPPGYIGYIALGRLLQPLFADPNTTLVAISIGAECLAVVLAYGFARRLFDEPTGLATGLALLVSPLFWYYGEAANTYALEPAIALGLAWLAWRAWHGHRGGAYCAAAALGVLGSIRPSTSVLLAPLVLYSVVRSHPPAVVVRAVGIASAGALAWVIPLLVASGGVRAYLQASLELGGSVSAGSAVWRAGLRGLAGNLQNVLEGVLLEVGLFAVPLVFGFAIAPRFGIRPRLPRGWGAFCAVWIGPSLATYLFVHVGQVAYVQSFAPALLLSIGPALSATVATLRRVGLFPAGAAAAAFANALLFLAPVPQGLASQEAAHDRWVAGVIDVVEPWQPQHTLLVSDGWAAASYRTAQVYLPEYHRVAIAVDRRGRVGEVYADVYELGGLARARPLQAPDGITTYVFMDQQTIDSVVADPERMQVAVLPDHRRVYFWTGPAPRAEGKQVWLGPRYHDRRGLG